MTETNTEKVIEGEIVQSTGDPKLDALLGFMGPIKVGPKMKLFVFGEPGAGKSTLAATAPKPLYVDIDEGPIAIPHIAKSEGYFKFHSLAQLELLVQYLKKGHEKFDSFESVVIDTLSEFHKRGLTEVAKRRAKEAGLNNSNKIESDYHQENNERVRRFVSDLRDLDRHLIVTCHTKHTKEQGSEGVTTYTADFSEKLNNTVAAVFDISMYLKQETDMKNNTASIGIFKSAGAHKVKTRIKTLPPSMVNPTFNKIYDQFLNHLGMEKENE